MIRFQLEGHEYKTPDGWHEVKFAKFLQFLEEVQPLCPKALLKVYEAENIELYWLAMSNRNKARCYQYFAKSVGFWCGLPAEIIEQSMDKEELSAAYWAIELDLSLENSQINEEFTGFKAGNKEYLLPQKYMIGSTVLEFTESAHFEQQMEDVKNGKWLALLDIMAVLCRPKGEVYNYEKGHHEMRKNIFKNVTMDIVLNVSFFLFRLNEALNQDLMIYSPANVFQTEQARAVSKKYGWATLVYRIAESKMFDISGKTSLKAAEDADLYEAFNYLAQVNALESLKKDMKTTITQISNIFNLLSQIDVRIFNYHHGYRYDINQNITNNFDPANDTGRLFPAVMFDVPDNVKYLDKIDYIDVQEEIQCTLYFDDLQGYNNDGSQNILNPVEQWQRLKQIAEDFLANFRFLFEEKYGAGSVGLPTFVQRANLYNDRIITWEVSFQLTHAIPCTEAQYIIDENDFPDTLDDDDLERTTGTPPTACDRIISQLNDTLLLTCVLPLYNFAQAATQNALSVQQVADLKNWLLPLYDFSSSTWQNLLSNQQKTDLTTYLLPSVDFSDVTIQALLTTQQKNDILEWLFPLLDFADPATQALVTVQQQEDLQTWLCTPAPPAFDYSFSMNGVNQYIRGQAGGVYNLNYNNAFSVITFCTIPSFATFTPLFTKIDNLTIGIFFALNSTGKIRLLLINSIIAAGRAIEVVSVNSVNLNVLQSIGFTYGGSGNASGVKLYLNGVNQAFTTVAATLSQSILNSVNVEIGASSPNSLYANYEVNNCRVWNVALSPADALTEGVGTGGKPNAAPVDSANCIMDTDFDSSTFGLDTFTIMDESGASSGFKTINMTFSTRFVQP